MKQTFTIRNLYKLKIELEYERGRIKQSKNRIKEIEQAIKTIKEKIKDKQNAQTNS